jgi:hypothetical protein
VKLLTFANIDSSSRISKRHFDTVGTYNSCGELGNIYKFLAENSEERSNRT